MEKESNIKVELIAHTNTAPLDLISHAARTCYTSKLPPFGEHLDVDRQLFKTGHHTTLQHPTYTFSIEGLSVGDVTFGLHLNNPFYDTDQRSGRYSKMFKKTETPELVNYIDEFWPELDPEKRALIQRYLENSLDLYESVLAEVKPQVGEKIKSERPFIKAENIDPLVPKIAQEQTRVILPTIIPTALDFTIDLSTATALYKSAWNPIIRHISEQIAEKIVQKFPELEFCFISKDRNGEDWSPSLNKTEEEFLRYKPSAEVLEISGDPEKLVKPEYAEMYHVDTLHFHPRFMNNNTSGLKIKKNLSIMSMGQDQRHRTIRRSEPHFIGQMYIPPLLKNSSFLPEIEGNFGVWLNLKDQIPDHLWTILAPYGAMIEYESEGSWNALIHEQAKRLCFCAQEEIYHLSQSLRQSLIERVGPNSNCLQFLSPACAKGPCVEGTRYCGRDLRQKDDYFPEREI